MKSYDNAKVLPITPGNPVPLELATQEDLFEEIQTQLILSMGLLFRRNQSLANSQAINKLEPF